ncbi:LutC/YkgG family protein [Flavobacterium agrisoli]|uniref:LUD domain-containing protein n=1 Tax=Flavobacterium agrisoli TaxID=2793066 RepID=A0A934UJC1_9FLAO|nr:LUD domain-containing protein [Flavobacterium agrisoli]MBK0369255.1 LUD domain-containing protein [Flavobacterium agrisoli]
MSSRESILNKIKQNQPKEINELPDLEPLKAFDGDVVGQYKTVLKGIGGNPVEVNNYEEIIQYIQSNYAIQKRVLTTLPELASIAKLDWKTDDPHSLENVELMVVKAHFGVAENSSLYVTDAIMGQRVATFIPQYLAIIVNKKDILPKMHHAYERIGDLDYGFATFIAGPSKTADIEQSLVLGAHGARSLTVFIVA